MGNPSDNTQYLQHLQLAYQWINKSLSVNQSKGSSAYFSLLSTWSKPYPETSGYLIPTLIKYHQTIGSQEALDHCDKIVRWLLGIQKNDGSFPQGLENNASLVFDNGQIFLGLQAWDNFNQKESTEVEQLSLWLKEQRNDHGVYFQNTYVENYCPSYLVRSLWAEVAFFKKNDSLQERQNAINSSVNYFLSLQTKSYSFLYSGFGPNEVFAYTHTIAYTLRGLLELFFILHDEQIKTAVLNTAMVFVKIHQSKGKLAGSYDVDWNGNYTFQCNTGNAQLCILFFKLYDLTNEESFKKIANSLLKELNQKQIRFGLKSLKGGLFSSTPFYGEYQRCKISNWTLKFYMDALMTQIKS